jgi:hypothetical protein
VLVAAPTGVAALIAEGQTLHSKPGPGVPKTPGSCNGAAAAAPTIATTADEFSPFYLENADLFKKLAEINKSNFTLDDLCTLIDQHRLVKI